jgi:hypothetical protein
LETLQALLARKAEKIPSIVLEALAQAVIAERRKEG